MRVGFVLRESESKVILQTRDLELLRICYEQQFLVYEQVEKYLFKEVSSRIARRRILKLKSAGLLRREEQNAFSLKHVLRVTKEGQKLAESLSPFCIPQSKKTDLATFNHDRIVTDVRLRLSEFWDGVWTPEKALKDKYPIIPDGLFQFEKTGTAVALEIENSLKGKTRFLELLKEWQRVDSILLVIFIATDQKIFNAIKNHLEHAPAKPAFGLIELNSFLSASPKLYSSRGTLDVFSKREL